MTITVSSPAQVDLGRHGIIEASAGAGKTYLIEHLVVRLVTEIKIPIERILVITFTEKATSELTSRIRSLLHLRSLDQPSPEIDQALRDFDNNAISTIHGFCQGILSEFAFETGATPDRELVDDGLIFKRILHCLIERDWPKRFGERLPFFMTCADFPDYDPRGKTNRFLDRCMKLARISKPEAGDRVRPAPLGDDDPRPTLKEILGLIDSIADLDIGDSFGRSSVIHRYYETIGLKTQELNRKLDILDPLIAFYRVLAGDPLDQPDLVRICYRNWKAGCTKSKAARSFNTIGFRALYPDKLPADSPVPPSLEKLVAQLEDNANILDRLMVSIENHLLLRTIAELRAKADQHKQELGLLSFDDMLTSVHLALDPGRNPTAEDLGREIGEKYQVALIDEFQDTDRIQWGILERLFTAKANNKIFVIGDPKQAIYAFRGADLATFQSACRELIDRHQAISYRLDRNFRSVEALVEWANDFFPLWSNEGSGFTHPKMQSPPPSDHPFSLVSDRTGRCAVNFIDLRKYDDSLGSARTRMAHFTVAEIERLLGEGTIEYRRKTARTCKLRPNDIAILLRSAREAEAIEPLLKRRGIPYTYYKKPGLYSGREALELHLILDALAEPGNQSKRNRALLSSFFEVKPADLIGSGPLHPDHPIQKVFNIWLGYIDRGLWSDFFTSLLRESDLACRLLLESDGERRIANFVTLMAQLEEKAIDGERSIGGLLRQLDRAIQSGQRDGDSDLHPLETEEDKVQMMTIHTSKGLEFPIVFLCGGYTASPSDRWFLYHDRDLNRVFDLDLNDRSGEELDRAERSAEDTRIFYVAITRAMAKCYLPFLAEKFGTRKNAGPLARLISPSITAYLRSSGIKDERKTPPVYCLIDPDIEQPKPPAADKNRLSGTEMLKNAPLINLVPFDREKLEISPFERRRILHSFSSLALETVDKSLTRDGLAKETVVSFEHSRSIIADELNRDILEDSADDCLPAGKETGTLIHEIFERLQYRTISGKTITSDNRAALRKNIEDIIDQHSREKIGDETSFSQEILDRIDTIVFHSLSLPLPGIGPIAGIEPENRRHELPFTLDLTNSLLNSQDREIQSDPAILIGTIDLLFRFRVDHEKWRYCFVDWKSNRIAPDYRPERLAQVMNEHGYELQYRIYSIALLTMIACWYPLEDPLERFAGGYYLFCRGIEPNNQQSGIWHRRPQSWAEIVDDHQAIVKAVREYRS